MEDKTFERSGGYVHLNNPLEFSIGYQFYYCGKMFCSLMTIGFVKDLTRLFKQSNKNKVYIVPEDYKTIKDNIILRPTTCSTEKLEEDVSMFKKRFGCNIEDWIAPLLMKAVSNIKVVPDYTKNERDEFRDTQYFDLIIPKYEELGDEKYSSYSNKEFHLTLSIIGFERKLYSTDYKNTRVELTDLDVKSIQDALIFNPDTSGQGKLDF